MGHEERRLNRLRNFDYSSNGLYFITICTKDRIRYLSEVISVGNAALGVPRNTATENDIFDVPIVKLTKYGEIVNSNIKKINEIYRYVSVTKYVIMPDHIHMILFVSDYGEKIQTSGTPRAAFPTKSVSRIINGLKSISTKQIGFSIWQKSFHDHIIRNEKEFLEICSYIDNNPTNWVNDIYNQNYWR
ncbi:MAG: transposase [Ruminococcus sp.]|nr:transposase [Ruminococcus sp.]